VSSQANTLMEAIGELPTLPTVAIELTRLLDDPNTEVKQIQAIVQQDPTLCSRLLKLVNSAFYGIPREVHSIATAINILGFNAVKNIALSCFVFDFFGSTDEDFDLNAFWKHSMATGVAFAETARVSNQIKVQDAYIFGLLHDLGRLSIKHFAPEMLQKAQDTARMQNISLTQAETDVIGINHAEVGYKLAERWGFPEPLAAGMRYHHTPEQAPDLMAEFAALTHVADLVTYTLDLGDSGEAKIFSVSDKAFELLKIDQAKLGEIMDGTLANLKQCGPMISIMKA